MRVQFRQGILKAPTGFLVTNGDNINLNIPPNETILLNIADNASNYIITERFSVSNAWVGPFSPTVDYYLYWDFNVLSGVRTFGYTIESPVEGPTPPTQRFAPSGNNHRQTHWFDTTTNTMKVWSGVNWVRKLRVFAAHVQSGGVFVSMSNNSPAFTGTQVGSVNPTIAGAWVYDINGHPLKKGNGQFFTTEDAALTGVASSTQVKFGSIMVEAITAKTLPAFTVVRFTNFNEIDNATDALLDNGVYGIIEQSVIAGERVNVVLEGIVENINWDWTSAGINAPLYSNLTGQLTTTRSSDGVIIASVVDKTKILLRPSSLLLNTSKNLSAIENLATNGIAVRVAQDTWVTRSISGITDKISVTNGTGIAGNVSIDISQNYVGQPSITTLGTITTGVWNGSVIPTTKGGTGLPTIGTQNQLLGVSSPATNGLEYKSIVGTANQIKVTHTPENITLSLPDTTLTQPDLTMNVKTVSAQVIKSPLLILAPAPSVSWSLADGIVGDLTLDQDVTIANPTNVQTGALVTLIIRQNGVGGHAVIFDTNFRFANGTPPVLPTTASAISTITFVCGNTFLLETSRAVNLS